MIYNIEIPVTYEGLEYYDADPKDFVSCANLDEVIAMIIHRLSKNTDFTDYTDPEIPQEFIDEWQQLKQITNSKPFDLLPKVYQESLIDSFVHMGFDNWEVSKVIPLKDGRYEITISGGENGKGDWENYFQNFVCFISKYKNIIQIKELRNDILDDVWYLTIIW